ncbi:LPXTG cell wall anchor domain-containing protein [Listeria seeligeri]|uniref:LPXTG cell wall anchor domain-containing protein n=1 Tax=Listeria seeligeri TaxID=1640 RepID=UPI0016285AE8|nr:LPXTG cell wall anchor domain-containing protein [Listeria seeligeri]MBC1479740.1 LPXTG cell wall anchor domain-containing protein [Listeria seeligeri]
MKNIKRKLIVILAFGLVLSISTPVFATETEEQKDTTNPVATPLEETAKDNVTEEQKNKKESLMAPANAVIAKTGLSFEIGATPTANDFVTINDATNNPTVTFKNGQPVTTTAGNFTTVILVTFDDTTSTEITANYIVNAAAPLATLKTKTPIIAQGSKPTPSQFATPAAGVKLSFKSGTPSTKKTGTFKTTIVATKNGKTEELVATYTVTDQTAPKIKTVQEHPTPKKGDVLTPADLAIATDNSGKVTLAFKHGHEPSTSTLGEHETVLVATDAAGNTTEKTIWYFVINNTANIKTPTIDVEKSTSSRIYGTTSPNTYILVADSDRYIIDMTYSDATGHFMFEFDPALEPGEEIILFASSQYDYSEEAHYIYDEGYLEVNEQPKTPSNTKTTKTTKTNITVNSNKTTTEKDVLPKTGDDSSLPLATIGLILASGAAVVLRKK